MSGAQPMTPYDRALQAVEQLAPEDVPLLLHDGILKQIPFEDWPAVLFSGRPACEAERMVLWLWLGFTPVMQAQVIGVLVEKLVDRSDREAAAALVSLAAWIEAGSRSPQWPR